MDDSQETQDITLEEINAVCVRNGEYLFPLERRWQVEDSQESRKDLPMPLAAALWLVSALFWGGALFMAYQLRVIVMAVVLAIICTYFFLGAH